MKKIDIVGQNYSGKWSKTRTACRGIIIKNNKILLSYETKTSQWMIPGGGLEDNETEAQCCVREVGEETGVLITPSPCLLEIDEYYKEWKWVNLYFCGTVKGASEMNLTESEQENGMEPRWIDVDNALSIFSKYADYAGTDEMRRGMYLREYTALTEMRLNVFNRQS